MASRIQVANAKNFQRVRKQNNRIKMPVRRGDIKFSNEKWLKTVLDSAETVGTGLLKDTISLAEL